MNVLRKILHVDDSESILEITKLCLEIIGQFDLVQCSSGKAALKAAQVFQPDLILLDAMMPGMSGLETLRELQKLSGLEDIPVVFMTAKVQPQEIEGFVEAGAIGVIKKPFDPMTLSDQIKSAWNDFFQHEPRFCRKLFTDANSPSDQAHLSGELSKLTET